MASEGIVRAHCNACGHETNHRVIGRRERRSEEDITGDGGLVDWLVIFEMLECCGCEEVSLRRSERCPQMDYNETKYFPPRVARRLPVWYRDLRNEEVKWLLVEVYDALYADNRRLAMMGARTLIDLVLLDEVGDVGAFGQKLDALVQQGSISTRNREFLQTALDAGSAAVHRGHRPGAAEVNSVMDIIENLLQAVYVLKGAAEKLKKATPPRQGSAPKKNSNEDNIPF